MLKKRIIPIVLLDGFSVLKTIKFNTRRNLGSPITVMRTYNTRNVDELIILDIDASKQNRPIDHFTIKEITNDCFMPLTVGGGIKNCHDIENILKFGADKVSFNSAAINNSKFVDEAVKNFGSQCIVISIDVIKSNGNYFVFSQNKINLDLNLMDWCKKLSSSGVGEILINNVSLDGTMEGCDSNLAKKLVEKVKVPFIFAGGVSSPQNVAELFALSDIDAVGVSSIFHFTDYTPKDCRKALLEAGIPARSDYEANNN